jgi:peptidylprolyl isomerase
MPNAKRTRERQLAKQAQRRKIQQQARRRRRNATFGFVATLAAAALLVVAFFALTNDGGTGASPSATKSPKASHGPKPEGLPTPVASVSLSAPVPKTVACGATVPAAAAEPRPQFDRAPSPADVLKPNKAYTAVIETSCGTFEIELLPDVAPNTVASFVFLAEQHYFDGQFFHRIVPGFVIQGGSADGTGGGPTSGPGYAVDLEVDPEVNFDKVGTLAMAHTPDDVNSNASQWFVTLAADPGTQDSLNQQYSIFGRVAKGMDVVMEIGAVPTAGPSGDTPTQAVYIDKVTITETKAPLETKTPTATETTTP